MIKNRELALIPDSALELLEPPATSPAPRPSTARPTRPTTMLRATSNATSTTGANSQKYSAALS